MFDCRNICRLMLIVFFGIGLIGCGADEDESVDKVSDKSLITLGAKKYQAENQSVAAAPEMPTDGRPSVTAVGYYRDWRLSKPFSGNVKPKQVIYTKIVFSEDMQHLASDTGNARPIISYVIGGKSTRFRVIPHGSKGADFRSGDAKPLGRNRTNQFVCKYTVKPEDIGSFTLKIGKFSKNIAGKTLSDTYRHPEHLQLRTLKPTGIHFFSDLQRTQPIGETLSAGSSVYSVYAEVRFDDRRIMDNRRITDIYALPELSYKIADSPREPFRILKSQAKLQTGDAKLLTRKSLVLCMLSIPEDLSGPVSFYAENSYDYPKVAIVYELLGNLDIRRGPFRPVNEYVDPSPRFSHRINEALDRWYDAFRTRVDDDRTFAALRGVLNDVPYTLAIQHQIAEIYEEVLELPFVETEYLKIAMLNPGTPVNQLLAMLRKSLLHSVDWDMMYRQLRRRYYLFQLNKYSGDLRLVISRAARIFGVDMSEIYNGDEFGLGDDSGLIGTDRQLKVSFQARAIGAYVRLKLEHPDWGWEEIWPMLDPDGLNLARSIVPYALELPTRNFSLK